MVHLLKLMKIMEKVEMGGRNHLSRNCLQKGGVSHSIIPTSLPLWVQGFVQGKGKDLREEGTYSTLEIQAKVDTALDCMYAPPG